MKRPESEHKNDIRKVIIMTKGTLAFRIIISVLLAITTLCCAFFAVIVCLAIAKEGYGIYVAGVAVTRSNEDDILGDGTVYYDSNNNLLVLNNATIESENTVVYSKIDLHITLIGENELICTTEGYGIGIYAGDYNLNKDLAIIGDGSLTIRIPNATGEAAGISAENLIVAADLTVVTPDCEKATNGIVCTSSLVVANKASITVHNGAAMYCAAVRVRGNALFEEGTALKVSTNPGGTGICKGFAVSGDLFLGKDTVLDVSLEDGATDQGECIRVSGLMEVSIGASVTAAAKNIHAIECYGAIEANEGATVSAVSDQNDADIFCSGAVVNRGAEFTGEIDAIGGVCNRD